MQQKGKQMAKHRLDDFKGKDHVKMLQWASIITAAKVDGKTGVWAGAAQMWDRDRRRGASK